MNYVTLQRYRFVRKVIAGMLQGLSGAWLFGAFVMTGIGESQLAVTCVLMSIASATLAAMATP